MDEDAPIAGLTLHEAGKEGSVGDDTIVVALQRNGDVLIPRGQTRIEAGDLATVFSASGATARTTSPFET